MDSIINEILEFRKQEQIAGRNPTEIALSRPQRRRLKRYCKKQASTRYVAGLENQVFGMRVIPKK